MQNLVFAAHPTFFVCLRVPGNEVLFANGFNQTTRPFPHDMAAVASWLLGNSFGSTSSCLLVQGAEEKGSGWGLAPRKSIKGT